MWSGEVGPWRRVAAGAEKVARSPEVRRGAKLTAEVGMEMIRAAAPIVGNIGKFAAKTAFSVSAHCLPLLRLCLTCVSFNRLSSLLSRHP